MAKTWATKCCSGTYKNNYQLCCGIKALIQSSRLISGLFFKARDTVGMDTPNICAKSFNEVRLDSAISML